jgi:hypothetical protein
MSNNQEARPGNTGWAFLLSAFYQHNQMINFAQISNGRKMVNGWQ